jgi:hypothetical protein
MEKSSSDARKMLRNLARLIAFADNLHVDDCLSGTPTQVRARERVDAFRHAFAIASGTTLGGLHYNQLLKEMSLNWALPESPLDSEVAKKVRIKAKSVCMGHDSLQIPDDADVKKVEDGYWVDARVWVDDELCDLDDIGNT